MRNQPPRGNERLSELWHGGAGLRRPTEDSDFYPPCVFHSLTGLQCPGCGTTRALHHLLHGDIVGAFHLNAMLFVVVPFGVLASASRRFATHPLTGWAAAVVTVAWWIGRNLMHH